MGQGFESHGFFFNQAHARIVRTERYFRNIFERLYQSTGRNNKSVDLRDARSIIGEYINEQGQQLKRIANFDLDKEEKLRRIAIYDYLYHLQALLDKQESESEAEA